MLLVSYVSEIAEILDLKPKKIIMVSFWLEMTMPTTLTLKNIPDALYGRLKETANAHRRSLNSEVIVCLESILLPQKISVNERLARARQIRQTLAGTAFSAQDIAQFRGEDRP